MSRKGRRHGKQRGLSKSWTWILVLAVVLGFGGFILQPVWQPLLMGRMHGFNDPASLSRGKDVYQANCAACHGPNAEGQVPSSPMGGQRNDGTFVAPALNGTGHMWHHAMPQLFEIVKNGSPAASSPMVAFRDRLNDDEIRSVLAYLQSLWPEQIRARYGGMHRG